MTFRKLFTYIETCSVQQDKKSAGDTVLVLTVHRFCSLLPILALVSFIVQNFKKIVQVHEL